MNYELSIRLAVITVWGMVVVLVALPVLAQTVAPTPVATTTDQEGKAKQEISDREAAIQRLNQHIEELAQKRDTTAAAAEVILQKLDQLRYQLQKAELELEKTQLTISQVGAEQGQTEKDIAMLQQDVEMKREQLRLLVRDLYEKEQSSWVRLFFDTLSLSEVLAQRAAVMTIQDKTLQLVRDMREQVEALHQKEAELEQQALDLNQLENLLSLQQAEVATQKSEQQKFLNAKQSEQAAYEHLLKDAQQARQEIAKQIFTLKEAGVEVTLTSALDMARYAGSRTGVDPAILLAVLKVESNVGTNIGGGAFPDDMHPDSRDAFLRITKKLGLDPLKTPVARRPPSGEGWGGAMGPAQIMPATWEGIEEKIEQLAGKSPVNPYDLTHAFVGTSILLARAGANDPTHVREAVGRYIAGPNWQYYSWYVDRVMAVANEYAKELH